MKIRITATWEFEPRLEWYPGAKTIEDCLEIEQDADNGPELLVDAINNGHAKVTMGIVEVDE